jgi:hypothetical protein
MNNDVAYVLIGFASGLVTYGLILLIAYIIAKNTFKKK